MCTLTPRFTVLRYGLVWGLRGNGGRNKEEEGKGNIGY